ncbi:hypothetical protein TBLA_0J01860 [Henningerozyma blattae CBS 6284]|uniref:Actin cytoskeleton-regulatory complex protein PAN1 n=1 Tax=Henningerozyma blattae (strain ATCC 34711 / CBS 6284 / DSM 70876 / NBRC 10599 / NRRL Y-10934 / UCD 77-7) TaxID=1071380 RepID=I2H9X9_HENB6|nr:hypothetical protein TBLA_0J01860 [Tetrapisispora blattae CBS 6284]CCH63181.1 hypothetical protein TBLA_0J01860 [Tetrapisispora blattae CBS 6284]
MYNPYQQQQGGGMPQQWNQPQNSFQQQQGGYPQQQPQPQQMQNQQQWNQQMQTGYNNNPQMQGGFSNQQQMQPNYNTQQSINTNSMQSVQPQNRDYYSQMNTTNYQQSPNYQSPQPQMQQPFTQPLQPQLTQGLLQQQPQQQQQFTQPLQPQLTQGLQQQQFGQPLQPQLTQPLQPLQPQLTQGLQPLQPQLTQGLQPLQPQLTQKLLPQQTGFYASQFSQQGAIEPLKPTATGFVNSFAKKGVNTDLKIPPIRLTFITAHDQAKFETLFRSQVKQGNNTISGEDCRKILMKSGLKPSQLAKIWTLSDTNKAGRLMFPEFCLAMHLVNDVLLGGTIPYDLDTKTKNEVSSFIDRINVMLASKAEEDSKPKTPFDNLINGLPIMQPQPTGSMPLTSFGMPVQSTGGGFMMSQLTGGALNPQSTGFMPKTSFGMPMQMTGGLQSQITGGLLNPQSTGFMPQTSFGMSMQMTGGLANQITGGALQPQSTGIFGNNFLPQATGGMNPPTTFMQSQATGSMINNTFPNQPPISFPQGNQLQSQLTGNMNNNMGMNINMTGNMNNNMNNNMTGNMNNNMNNNMGMNNNMTGNMNNNTGGNTNINSQSPVMPLQPSATGVLPSSNFNATKPLTAQKTGFGNNELYNKANFGGTTPKVEEDTISDEEKSLFYKIFQTYDTKNTGLLDSPTAVEIFRKSGLNRADLEHIWNLCDTNNSGSLNKQEFAVGMHLVYEKLNGKTLPNRLPPSLVPSTNKILDNLKNQLMNTEQEQKPQSTRMNALNYKNNDEQNSLPNFRNRRRTTTEDLSQTNTTNNNAPTPANNPPPPPPPPQAAQVSPALPTTPAPSSSLSPAPSSQPQSLKDNGSPGLKSVPQPAPVQPIAIESERTKTENLKSVDRIKSEILSLPVTYLVPSTSLSSDLQNRIEEIVKRIPNLFAEISDIENAISESKIKLYRAKNPTSIVGTGPKGQITEEDRKKAKSRAVLKSRMAALTGKGSASSDSSEEDERRYNAAINQINLEAQKNIDIISDVRSSISEICASLVSTLTNGNIGKNKADFEKWEFGIGLESEIHNFIATLKSQNSLFAKPSNLQDGRAELLKQQAHKKMDQRLAELGMTTNSTTRTDNQSHSLDNVRDITRHEAPTSTSQQYESNTVPSNLQDSDEDDEEERKLREELDRIKSQKKSAKEKRLAELRRQVEQAQSESGEDSNDPLNKEIQSTTTPVHTQNRVDTPATHNQMMMPPSNPGYHSNASTPVTHPPPMASNSANNYASPNVNKSTSTSYFGSQSSGSSFNKQAAEAQRRSQRGLDDSDSESDGWSDAEEETSSNKAPSATTYVSSSTSGQIHSSNTPTIPSSRPSTKNNVTPLNSPSIPVSSPIAQVNSNNPSPAATIPSNSNEQVALPPIPIAPLLPEVHEETVTSPPIPIAPPLPEVHDENITSPPIPVAPPLPQIQNAINSAPPIPVAAPIPQIHDTEPALPAPMEPPLPSSHTEISSPSGIPPPPLFSPFKRKYIFRR